MTTLLSRLDVRSSEFEANRAEMLRLLERVNEANREALEGGGARYVDRHRSRDKLLARERIELLVDRDSALVELSPLAGWGTKDPLGSGIVTAIGVVSGRECVIIANDPTVRGGSQNPSTVAQ